MSGTLLGNQARWGYGGDYPYRYIGYGGLLADPVQRIWTNHVETCGRA